MMKPTILAMVPCKEVTRSHEKGSATIVEAAWNLHASEFPFEFAKFSVYLATTEIHGSVELKLRVSPADQGYHGQFMSIVIASDSPLGAKETVCDLAGWTIAYPGQWIFDLIWNEEILVSRRVRFAP